jgi:biotin carboxylase
MPEPLRSDPPHVVIVGSGDRPYREYAFQSLAARYRLSAVLPGEPSWQRPYLGDWRVCDLSDVGALTAALASLAGPRSGVLTWVETALEHTAQAAEALSLRHMSARSAARCRDKYLTRTLLADSGASAVRFELVHSTDDAVRAAKSLGLPVVVKPRALAGSVGVTVATDVAEVRAAFDQAIGSGYATLPTGHGILIEEYLHGPEISVDSVVVDGVATVVLLARKRLGFAPFCEEVGHLVADWSDEPWAGDVQGLVATAHRLLGIEQGVTHAEIRLTEQGPRLVELNGRLGGDLIPFVGRLASGVDLVTAAAELSLGRRPDVSPTRRRAAEIRFVYPPHDGEVDGVDVTRAAEVPGVAHACVIAQPGARLRLPPHQAVPRLAALVAVGDDETACGAALDAAAGLVSAEVTPLLEPVR